jgi:hypothetical protein
MTTVTTDLNPHVATIQAYNAALYAAMGTGEIDQYGPLIAPYLTADSVCRETPALPWGGTWVGLEGYLGMFAKGMEVMASSAAAAAPETPVDTTVEGTDPVADEYLVLDDVVVRKYSLTLGANASHAALSMECLERYTMVGGLISEIDVFFFDVPAIVEHFAA